MLSPIRSAPLPTLLVGAFLLVPGAAARAGDLEFGSDANSEFLASLAYDPHARAEADAREAFARDIAKRLEERATERFWLSLSPDKPAGREVLYSLDVPPATEPPKDSFRDHFRLSLRRGIMYRQRFGDGEEEMSLKVWGPIVGSKPGLGLALDGRVERHRFRMKAYGSTEKAGIMVDLEF